MKALRFTHPMKFTGDYKAGEWAGYRFGEKLGYTFGQHTGVDYNYGYGDQDIGFTCHAIANGVVVHVGRYTGIGFGRTVIIRHDLDPKLSKKYGVPALYSRYMHLQSYSVKVGDTVGVGDVIGAVGDDATEWAHLHIDVWKNLGVHLEYHKSDLSNYFDPYLLIESHKNEQEDELITNNDRDLLRIIASEIKHWPRERVHKNGEFDKTELAYWSGRSIRDAVMNAWKSGQKGRERAEAALRFYEKRGYYTNLETVNRDQAAIIAELNKTVETLRANDGLSAKQIRELGDKIEELGKQLEAKQKEVDNAKEVVKEVNWIQRLLELFGIK